MCTVRRGLLVCLAVSIGLVPVVAKAANCQPAAVLSGPADLVGPVATLLEERGIATGSQPGCGFTRATLSVRENEILLAIVHDGRQIERRATTTAGIATIVESWVRSNLATSALVDRPIVAVAPPVEPPAAAAQESVRPQKTGKAVVVLSLLPAVGLANDNSVWTSISVGACVRISRICAGIAFLRAADTDLSGPAERLKTERQTYEAILTTEWQFRVNNLRLNPGVGIGIGWTHRKTDHDEVPPAENVAKVVGGLRLELRFLAALAIRKNLNLVWAFVADYAPTSEGAEVLPNNFTLAADPRWLARVGIGLSYEF